jgi:PIN domain nuclease of toxin-antitoxin system
LSYVTNSTGSQKKLRTESLYGLLLGNQACLGGPDIECLKIYRHSQMLKYEIFS